MGLVRTDVVGGGGQTVTDTVLIVGMNIISTTSSNLIDPANPIELTPDVISERVYGSKMVLLVEQMQLITIWLMKACLLIMYGRLTTSLTQHVVVKIVSAYVAIGFVVMEILYFGVWCRPFSQYWAVPPDNVQCSAATNHLITNAVLNISSDIMIILLPMPVFLKSQLPTRKKVMLCGIFALGTFTVLSAILNKYYSFNAPFASDWTYWYIRESSTAIITTNLPLTYTLVRIALNFFGLGSKLSTARKSHPGSHFRPSYGTRISSNARSGEAANFDRSDSQEEINREYGVPLRIYQKHEVRFSSHTIETRAERADRMQVVPESLRDTTTSKKPRPSGEESDDAASKDSAVGVVTVCH
ncbi:hypothetical protein MGN70_011317 [Eutypa lata]|nr:hypothetical protein MGN70_011317 [Eutypa lata]